MTALPGIIPSSAGAIRLDLARIEIETTTTIYRPTSTDVKVTEVRRVGLGAYKVAKKDELAMQVCRSIGGSFRTGPDMMTRSAKRGALCPSKYHGSKGITGTGTHVSPLRFVIEQLFNER